MRSSSFLFLLAALVIAAPGHAQPAAPGPDATRHHGATGQHDDMHDRTLLRLSESAERLARQDLLRAQLRVEATGAEPARIQAEINRKMTEALDKAKSVDSVKVETGSYFVHEDRRAPPAARWRGVQTLALSGKESGPLLALAGELQQQGFLFSGLSYELSREAARALEDELTREALQRLRARSERVAETMNLSIIRYREVRVGQTGRPPIAPIARMAAESAVTAAAPPPVAEPGETRVEIRVEADVVLGPRAQP
ncbi:MAG TPA: SIMPL domain-containing protein [Alphaproteobacteria bacterium]|nr:SIMPL domain-containing protein [Alphaproteobacteria bacterium]